MGWSEHKVAPARVLAISDSLYTNDNNAELIENFVNILNKELAEMEKEERKECYIGVTYALFKLGDDSELGGTTLSYCNNQAKVTPTVLAQAEAVVEGRKVSHEYKMQLYKVYDANVEAFEKLRKDVYSVGGELTFARPYIDVTLPVDDKALEKRTYRVTGHEHFLTALKCKLTNLGCRNL